MNGVILDKQNIQGVQFYLNSSIWNASPTEVGGKIPQQDFSTVAFFYMLPSAHNTFDTFWLKRNSSFSENIVICKTAVNIKYE